MKNRVLLSLFFVCFILIGHAKVWTISNSGTTFSPADITISEGDTVVFSLESMHDAVEVSKATYDANGTTPLSGGFSVAFGGDTVFPSKLTQGVHYFVCEPHASLGMKGSITVEANNTSIASNTVHKTFTVYPNPSNGDITVSVNGNPVNEQYALEVFDAQGRKVYEEKNDDPNVRLSILPSGIYILKLIVGTALMHKTIRIE